MSFYCEEDVLKFLKSLKVEGLSCKSSDANNKSDFNTFVSVSVLEGGKPVAKNFFVSCDRFVLKEEYFPNSKDCRLSETDVKWIKFLAIKNVGVDPNYCFYCISKLKKSLASKKSYKKRLKYLRDNGYDKFINERTEYQRVYKKFSDFEGEEESINEIFNALTVEYKKQLAIYKSGVDEKFGLLSLLYPYCKTGCSSDLEKRKKYKEALVLNKNKLKQCFATIKKFEKGFDLMGIKPLEEESFKD